MSTVIAFVASWAVLGLIFGTSFGKAARGPLLDSQEPGEK